MPLSAVRAGMTGYGLTVLHGTTIQRFDVKILGILHGGPTDLVLFRAGGPAIQEAGGNAAGMSGSPIYIGGRMLGALSYGYEFPGPDADLSLATPIEAMLKVLGTPRGSARVARPPGCTRPTGRSRRRWPADLPRARDEFRRGRRGLQRPPAAGDRRVRTGCGVAVRVRRHARGVSGPVAGASPVQRQPAPAVRRVGRRLRRRRCSPGSSLGVELVRGDAEMGGIGTVTYRRGDQILAFGHPMLNAGSAVDDADHRVHRYDRSLAGRTF